MVSISLYRGKLHRPSDAPRQWLMPTPTISLKDFRILLQRRSRALARLQSTTSNPNPNSARKQPQSNGSLEAIVKDENEDDNAKKGSTGDDDSLVIPSGELVALEVKVKVEVEVDDAKAVVTENDSNAGVDDLRLEDKPQATSERQSMILHDEEELQRRSNVQGITGRISVSLQVDATNDSGSMSKHNTPRPGSEGNCAADVERADGDDVSNQNMHSRNMTRMSSMSPSSDAFYRSPPFSMVPNPSRGCR